jgi:hypothetical protein
MLFDTLSQHSCPAKENGLMMKKCFSDMPPWAWIFVGGCILIPIVTLGGALPMALGVGGAAGCGSIARKTSMPTFGRVALCAGVTLLCWGLVAALVVGVALLSA